MRQLFSYSMLIIAIVIMSGCNQRPQIGFLMDNLTLERWEKDKTLFEEKVKELGGVVTVRIADSDPEKQLEQAKQLIEEGIDVLVVIPVDLEAAGQIVKEAHKSYIPVISYDRLIRNCNLDYYISTDNIHIGELQADYLTKVSLKENTPWLEDPRQITMPISYIWGG